MTLSELYEVVGGDYQNILERLGDKETIENFVLRFLDDSSYVQLLQCLQTSDLKHAFYAAHTLKGISQSLGFSRLGDCVETLCRDLRKGAAPSEITLHQLKTEFHCVIMAINDFKSSL